MDTNDHESGRTTHPGQHLDTEGAGEHLEHDGGGEHLEHHGGGEHLGREGGEHLEHGEIARLKTELAQTHDRHRRALADLDNYRKRVEREGDRRATDARHRLLAEWLEVRDSVERALGVEPDDPGLTAVLAQIDAILARHGVRRMDAAGALFDPVRFEAIAVQEDADAPDRTVVGVARAGFELDDGEVLRPAQVVVSKRAAGSAGGP